MSSKPTIVLVPGAWHTPATWDKVIALLEQQQFKCVAVALPSASSNPSATYLDDIEAVRSAITAETTQGRDVVIVVHSYGGMVGNSAIKGLTKPKDGSATAKGYVIGMAMMASGFTITGVSFIDGLGGKPPPFWKIDQESGFATIVADARELFYHDLPEEEGNYWVSKLEKQSLKSVMEGGEHSYSGWRDLPVWYLATSEDKAFPPPALDMQKHMVQLTRDAGGDITLREVQSSHSPMLSKPKETAEFILEAVSAFVG